MAARTATIATISGTMLTPGVSRNKRLYSRELIARAAARMQERIADPDGLPIVMRTHHDAGDDSRKIVGRLTGVKVGEDGAASYTADLYDTAPGRDIAALVVPGKDQAPALKSVSIHGYWLGPVKRLSHEGVSVTTAEDLEIDAVDFTASPGVLGATVAAASYLPDAPAAAESHGRTPISESVEATVEAVTEHAPDEAYSAKQKRQMAAKGQAMKNASGEPSYPIKTKADLRKAIRAVGRGGADHDKIRAHIIARAAALGLTRMIPDTWNKDGSMKENDSTRLGEIREYYASDGPGGAGFCIDAYNGPISLTMRACGIDPAELRVITAAAMTAAVDALQAMDPDMDADIDVDGAPHADTDGDTEDAAGPVDDMESAPTHDALTETSPTAPVGDRTEDTEVPAVSEAQTPAAETASTPAPAPMIALTQEQFAQLLDRVGPAHETAPAPEAPAAETAPAPVAPAVPAAPAVAAETEEQRFERTLQERVAAMKDELREELLRENGIPARQGYRVHENDQTGGADNTPEDLFANRAEILLGAFARTPQPAHQ